TFVTAKVPMQVTPTDAGAEGGSVDAGSQDAAAGDAGGPGDSGAAADATAPPDAGDDGGGFMVDASLADGGTAANTKSGCSCVVGAGGEGASGSLFLGLLAVAAGAAGRSNEYTPSHGDPQATPALRHHKGRRLRLLGIVGLVEQLGGRRPGQ